MVLVDAGAARHFSAGWDLSDGGRNGVGWGEGREEFR